MYFVRITRVQAACRMKYRAPPPPVKTLFIIESTRRNLISKSIRERVNRLAAVASGPRDILTYRAAPRPSPHAKHSAGGKTTDRTRPAAAAARTGKSHPWSACITRVRVYVVVLIIIYSDYVSAAESRTKRKSSPRAAERNNTTRPRQAGVGAGDPVGFAISPKRGRPTTAKSRPLDPPTHSGSHTAVNVLRLVPGRFHARNADPVRRHKTPCAYVYTDRTRHENKDRRIP